MSTFDMKNGKYSLTLNSYPTWQYFPHHHQYLSDRLQLLQFHPQRNETHKVCLKSSRALLEYGLLNTGYSCFWLSSSDIIAIETLLGIQVIGSRVACISETKNWKYVTGHFTALCMICNKVGKARNVVICGSRRHKWSDALLYRHFDTLSNAAVIIYSLIIRR